MEPIEPHKLLSLKSFLSLAILGIIGYSLSQLPDSFYETIGKWSGYKWLEILVVIGALIASYFLVLFLIVNHRLRHARSPLATIETNPTAVISEKTKTKNPNTERKSVIITGYEPQLKLLPKKEKEVLKQFLQQDSKIIVLSYSDDAVTSLRRSRYIWLLNAANNYGPSKHEIDDSIWNTIKFNSSLLD